MVMLRRVIGSVLRAHRERQGRTLRDVSAQAQVSLGYLSEVERGRKEASSELLAAICAALDVSLADVLREVSDELRAAEARPVALGFAPPAVGKPALVPGGRAVAAARVPAARPSAARPTAARPTAARPTAARPTAARPPVVRPPAVRPTAARSAPRPVAVRPATPRPAAPTALFAPAASPAAVVAA